MSAQRNPLPEAAKQEPSLDDTSGAIGRVLRKPVLSMVALAGHVADALR
jgi:hypothetical protein